MSDSRLVVRIERVEDRYEVTVYRGDGHAPVARGRFGDDEVPPLPPITVDGERAAGIPLAKAGQDLFALLMRAGLAAAWPAAGPAPALLLDVRDEELAQWPWELLEDRRTGRAFAARTAPAARGRTPFTADQGAAGVPIRLLVIVGDPTDDVLQPENEIEAIFEGLADVPCTWHVDVVRGPREDELFADYPTMAPDVLHVIGHGVPSWRGPAVQVRSAGGDWELSAQYLVQTLAGALPRLVVLNACRTAEQPNQALRLARGLVEGLLDNGVAATVAMQGDVASEPAASFTRQLYRGLAARRPLDAAVAEARALVGATSRFQARDWALPVLDLRADPARVLHQDLETDPRDVIRSHNGFEMVAHMVDRAPQRREFHDGRPRGAAAEDEPSGLFFVTGEEKVGKTMLARWCVVSHRVGGTPVVYHSLEGRNTVSTRDFLLNLVDAVRLWLGDDVATACADTATALSALFADGGARARRRPAAAGLIVTPARPGSAVDPAGTPARPVSVGDPAATGYSMVTNLLATLGESRPVVLVLDHLGLVEDKTALVNGLLKPASARELGPLRVVVVEQPGALVGIAGPRGTLPISPNIQVDEFPRADAGMLIREYLARRRPPSADHQAWDTLRAELIDWATAEVADRRYPLLAPVELAGAVEGRMLKFRLPYGGGQ